MVLETYRSVCVPALYLSGLRQIYRGFMSDADPSILEQGRRFASEHLGAASAALLAESEAEANLLQRFQRCADLQDAVLGMVHEASREVPELAGEFLHYFMGDVLMLGRSTLFRNLRTLLDTQDLVQSVMEDLLPELHRLEFVSRESFISLLARRLRWKAQDRNKMLRRGRRREDLRVELPREEATPPAPGQSPLSLVGHQEDMDRLLLQLMKLPEPDRSLLTLYLRGETFETMAEELQMSPEQVRQSFRKALQRSARWAKDS